MTWWNIIHNRVHLGNTLHTPGRGIPSVNSRPFKIFSKDSAKIVISSGSGLIRLEKSCFDTIARAFNNKPSLWLRIASLHENVPFQDSADEIIRSVTGSNLARGNYVCSILEHCKLVKFAMKGNRKVIVLP